MPKTPDFEHHQPRQIDKRKHHREGFSEDIQENRKTRVSFKNYVRSLDEDEGDVADEEWVLERYIGDYQDDPYWSKIMTYPTEEEAEEALEDYEKHDTFGDKFRIRQAD